MKFFLVQDVLDGRLVCLSDDEATPDGGDIVEGGSLVRINPNDPTDAPYRVLMVIQDEEVNRFLERVRTFSDKYPEDLESTLGEYTRLCGLARGSFHWRR